MTYSIHRNFKLTAKDVCTAYVENMENRRYGYTTAGGTINVMAGTLARLTGHSYEEAHRLLDIWMPQLLRQAGWRIDEPSDWLDILYNHPNAFGLNYWGYDPFPPAPWDSYPSL